MIPVLALLICTSAFADYRIATVDLGRVFTNYWKTKQAQTVIDETRTDFETKGKEMFATYNKTKDDYQKIVDSMNDPAVSATEREKRKKAAEDKGKDLKDQEDQINQFDRASRASLEEKLKRTRDNIVADIKAGVNGVGHEYLSVTYCVA